MEQWDVVIIGGGAAGLIATGAAARAGAKVLALEKMYRVGLKVGITGKGRCNLTNDKPLDEFIAEYRSGGDFLRSAFARFFAGDIIEILERRSVPCKTERGGRVFPQSDKAGDVVQALYRYARGDGGAVRTEAEVIGVEKLAKGFQVRLRSGELLADRLIIATGGKSYPRTGSTGDGYKYALRLGHTLVTPRPALTPIQIETKYEPFEVLLHNVRVTLRDGKKKIAEGFGEALFSENTLDGAIPVELSRDVEGLKDPWLSLDFKPALDRDKLEARLRRDLEGDGKRRFGAVLKDLLPAAVIPLFVEKLRLDPEKRCAEINKATRRALLDLCKDFPVQVSGVRGWDKAVITVGGIPLAEVDPRTMESRVVPGLFLCGEVLDIDGVTGGYNLQAAFSTGFVAGEAAARKHHG